MSSSPATNPADSASGPAPVAIEATVAPAPGVPAASRRRSSLVPRSLTSRLVVTSIGLIALASVTIALVVSFATRQYLYSQLDQRLQAEASRIDLPPGNLPQQVCGGEGPAYGFDVQTLIGTLNDARMTPQVVSKDGCSRSLGHADLRALLRLATGPPTTVDLPHLGTYRVVLVVNNQGLEVVAGLPTSDVDEAVARVVATGILIASLATGLAAIIGVILIRQQLSPLRTVAATAREVSRLPLEAGDVEVSPRVPDQVSDSSTEVGQVAVALNVLLDRVSDALEARHRSEEQVRQFVADASHELRTPLATIQGYAELSRRTGASDPATVMHALNRVESETVRMSALVDDLLLLARLDSGRPLERTDVDMSMIIVETVSDARVVSPDHVWRLDLPDEPVIVGGDPQRLHQVVSNLVRNAARHTGPGTTVTVGARLRRGSVEIRVHDNGPGLPADLAAHAFERFSRGDSSRTRESGGAGLGLSIVQAIVSAHGGRVSVRSSAGDTTFAVSLPSAHSPRID